MSSDGNSVWALRGVRPSTKRLFKQASILKGVNIGELADEALREAAQRVFVEAFGQEDAERIVQKLADDKKTMEPT